MAAMARLIRIEYEGAVYHVMGRGTQGRDIHADDSDRKLRLATLGEACEKTGWRIHARLQSDAGDWPAEAERAARTGAAEQATGAGL